VDVLLACRCNSDNPESSLRAHHGCLSVAAAASCLFKASSHTAIRIDPERLFSCFLLYKEMFPRFILAKWSFWQQNTLSHGTRAVILLSVSPTAQNAKAPKIIANSLEAGSRVTDG